MGSASSSDGQLWSDTASGDPDALAALYERHAAAVFNHCYQRLASRSDAEDVTAEVFLTALRSGSTVRLDPQAGLLPWLLAVANNLLRRQHTARGRTGRLLRRLAVVEEGPDVAETVTDRAADRYHLDLLITVLQRLSPTDRDVIQLCVVQGFSPGVVAAQAGRNPATVRSQLSRALARARAELARLQPAEPASPPASVASMTAEREPRP